MTFMYGPDVAAALENLETAQARERERMKAAQDFSVSWGVHYSGPVFDADLKGQPGKPLAYGIVQDMRTKELEHAALMSAAGAPVPKVKAHGITPEQIEAEIQRRFRAERLANGWTEMGDGEARTYRPAVWSQEWWYGR